MKLPNKRHVCHTESITDAEKDSYDKKIHMKYMQLVLLFLPYSFSLLVTLIRSL